MSVEAQHGSLTRQILIAMLAGLVLGIIVFKVTELQLLPPAINSFINEGLIDGLLGAGGAIFIHVLKLLVVPLVFVSLVCGVCSPRDGSSLGRVGTKTLFLYLLTTGVAVSLALIVATSIQPGAGADLKVVEAYVATPAPSVKDVIINIFPSNPVQAMAEANMLQVIVFSILLGMAIARSGETGKKIAANFQNWNEVVMKLVDLVMAIAPYGVFCLIAVLFAQKGLGFVGDLALYFITVALVLLIHGVGTFSVLLKFFAGISPLTFLKKMRPVMMFAFSTASSGATMPLTLKVVEEKLGVHNNIASFSIPLGTTINMDGTAIMQGVATVFIAEAYGVDIGMAGYLTVIAMAVLASIGTAAVPGAGMITLAMVLGQVGLPVEAIGLIIGVDRLLDMMRTAINVAGDAAVSCVVAKTENLFDQAVFERKD